MVSSVVTVGGVLIAVLRASSRIVRRLVSSGRKMLYLSMIIIQ